MELVSRIQNLIATDGDDDSERLVRDYLKHTKAEQDAIDNAFISLCGYRLITIINDPSLGEEL